MGTWREGARCPRRPARAREDLQKSGEQSSSSPKDRGTYFTQLAHPNLEAGTAQGPPDIAGGLSTGWNSLEAGTWLLGCLAGRGGVCGGRGRMILSPIQRHPSSLPEFLSSKTPGKFPQLPSPLPREGIGVRAPSQGRGEDLESPGPPPKKPAPSRTAHGLGVRFGNSEQEPRLEAATSRLHL